MNSEVGNFNNINKDEQNRLYIEKMAIFEKIMLDNMDDKINNMNLLTVLFVKLFKKNRTGIK